MGIPFYFREIVSSNRSILTNVNNCDRLYLDFNSIIHTSSQRTIGSKLWHSYKVMEEEIIKNIIASTYDIIKICPPRQLLYIGIDGVAPLPKIVQQRKRRHMSAHRNTIVNKFKDNHNIKYNKWDSNCITPGTQFMHRLTNELNAHFEQQQLPFEVVLSGPNQVGEGEHKIINYIKNLRNDKFVDVIYGLDADLIMLSLTCNKPKLYLMRDNAQFDNKPKYVDIDALRISVAKYLYDDISITFMMDYVFICFFLGNDFLPHFPSIDLRRNGLQYVCDIYREVYLHVKQNAVLFADNKYYINPIFFKQFIKSLASKEQTLYASHIDDYMTNAHYDANKPFKTNLDKFQNELDFSPVRNKDTSLAVQLHPEHHPFWKANYYQQFAFVNDNNIKAIDDICENYLEGISWNIDYYLNSKTINNWFYKYNVPPFFSDLHRFMMKTDNLPTPKKYDVNITDQEQLAIVLPIQSFDLLPKHISDKLTDISQGYVHLYPISFKINTFLKIQLWECTPVLPSVDITMIKELFQMR